MGVEKEENLNKNERLCFKRKIHPKPESMITTHDDHPNCIDHNHDHDQHMIEPDEENPDQDHEDLRFVCPVCNKRYKSGKALCGRKRIHNVQFNNNNNNKIGKKFMKPSNKRKGIDFDDEDNEEEGEDQDEPICPLCEKSFPSKKSLFGHMKSHSDRGWRGIQPPPYQRALVLAASSSISTQDHMINMVDESSSATLKRQVPMLSSYSSETPHSDLDLAKYVKQGNWSDTAKRGSGKSSSSSSAASTLVDITGMESDTKEAVIDLMLLAHHEPCTSLISTSLKNKNTNKKRRKKMKLVDREEGERQVTNLTTSGVTNRSKAKLGGGQYVCSDCKMSFPSYQALGGHRSSHRKKSIKINNRLSCSVDVNGDSLSSTIEIVARDDKEDHGGDHVSAQKGGSKIVFDFDLNELPPRED